MEHKVSVLVYQVIYPRQRLRGTLGVDKYCIKNLTLILLSFERLLLSPRLQGQLHGQHGQEGKKKEEEWNHLMM